jgi:hypothetical protein
MEIEIYLLMSWPYPVSYCIWYMNICTKIIQNKWNFYNSGFQDKMEYVDSYKGQECGILYAKSKSES